MCKQKMDLFPFFLAKNSFIFSGIGEKPVFQKGDFWALLWIRIRMFLGSWIQIRAQGTDPDPTSIKPK
jgi:hypothetical protein